MTVAHILTLNYHPATRRHMKDDTKQEAPYEVTFTLKNTLHTPLHIQTCTGTPKGIERCTPKC